MNNLSNPINLLTSPAFSHLPGNIYYIDKSPNTTNQSARIDQPIEPDLTSQQMDRLFAGTVVLSILLLLTVVWIISCRRFK
jgi:hypothetical protein